MPEASPTKWHRGHTTWFLETFPLARFGTAPVDARYVVVRLPPSSRQIRVAAGERTAIEVSAKHHDARIASLFVASGFARDEAFRSGEHDYALQLGSVR